MKTISTTAATIRTAKTVTDQTPEGLFDMPPQPGTPKPPARRQPKPAKPAGSAPHRSLFDQQPDWMDITAKPSEPTPEQFRLAKQFQHYLGLTMHRDGCSEEEAVADMERRFGRYPEFQAMVEANKAVDGFHGTMNEKNEDRIGTREMPLIVDM